MKFIPLTPKKQTTGKAQNGTTVNIHTRKTFDIAAIQTLPNGDLRLAVYGDAAGLGDYVDVKPDDFEIPDALKVTQSTYLKDTPKDSSLPGVDKSKWENLAHGDFVVGRYVREHGNYHHMLVDGQNRYVFKGHAEIATAKVTIAQQGDELICKAALDLIKEFEGCKLSAYTCPAGIPTIGYGNTKHPDGRKVKLGETITQTQANEYLIEHITESCKDAMEKIPTWSRMNPNQQGAIYSFAYNLGSNFYGMHPNFTSITKVCDSPDKWDNLAWITEQFEKYRNPGSQFEEGLRRRRIAEAKLFCKKD